MGSKAGWESVGGAAANVVTGGGYGAKKAAKAQARAADEMAAAMKKAPEAEEVPVTETEDVSKATDSVNGGNRRRYKLADTRKKTSLSALSGLKDTLG